MFEIATSNLIFGLAKFLDLLLTFFMYIILGRVIVSWVNADPHNPIVRFLVRVTEPVLSRLRRLFPALTNLGGLDLTPLLVIGVIYFVQIAVVNTLLQIAAQMNLR